MDRILYVFCALFAATSAYGQSGYGRLVFLTEPDTLYLLMPTTQLKHATTDTLVLPAGDYKFTVVAKGYVDRTVYVYLQDGESRNYFINMNPVVLRADHFHRSSYAYLEYGKSIHIETDLDSRIEVNGVTVGEADWMMLTVASWVDIKVTHPLGRTRSIRAQTLENRLNSIDLHVRMSRREHLIYSLLPGYSHYRKNQYVRMVAAPVAVAGLLGLSIYTHLDYLSNSDDYEQRRELYLNSPPQFVDYHANLARKAADTVNASYVRRNAFIAATVMAYVASYVDGARAGAIGYRQGGMRLDPYIEANPNGDGFLSGFKLSRDF